MGVDLFLNWDEAGRDPQVLGRRLETLGDAGLDVVKTENLYTFDGEPGYSAAQGE